MMKQATELPGVFRIIENELTERHEWRCEIYSWIKYHMMGIKTLFTIDYETKVPFKNTLRGLFFQNEPLAQTLLIRCERGAVAQAVVDIRPSSKFYGKGMIVELRENDNQCLYIPKGFAHGFLCLEDDTVLRYKADNSCSSDAERFMNYADETVSLLWPSVEGELIISEKDKYAPMLSEIDCNYI